MRLVEELPEDEVSAVPDDVRRHVRGSWLPAWFGAGEGLATDVAESRQVSDPGSIQYLVERGGHEDAQVPPAGQLRAGEEHPVKEQHRVRRGRRGWRRHSGVRVEVVDRVLVAPVAARAQWVKQEPAERVVVEGAVVVGFGRELAAPVALCPGQVEAFGRGADDFAAPAAKGAVRVRRPAWSSPRQEARRRRPAAGARSWRTRS